MTLYSVKTDISDADRRLVSAAHNSDSVAERQSVGWLAKSNSKIVRRAARISECEYKPLILQSGVNTSGHKVLHAFNFNDANRQALQA